MLLAMISGSLGFYALALAHPDALVVDDAYGAGLRYNEAQATRRRAAELGYALSLSTRPTAGGVAVTLRIRDAAGTPVQATSAVLRRERPSQGGYDAVFPLTPANDGFAATVPLPLPGRWHLVASAEVAGASLERSFALESPR
jgi:nitrogen fixation protein FixH